MLRNFWKRSNFFTIYWCLSIILLPFYIEVSKMDSRIYKDILFLKMSLVSLCLFPKSLSNLSKFAGLALIYSMFNYHSYSPSGVFQLVHLALGAALIDQFIANWDKRSSKYFLNAIAITCIIQATYFYINALGYDVYTLITGYKRAITDNGAKTLGYFPLIGSLDHWMVSGSFLAITFPTLFRKKWCFFIPYILGVLTFIDSSLTVVSVLGTGVVWLMIKYRKLIIPSIMSGAIAIYFVKDLPFFTMGERWNVWVQSFSFNTKPLFGMGFGYFHDNFRKFYVGNEKFAHPHNEFIDLYVTLGLWGVGVGLYLSFLLWKNRLSETHFFYCIVAFFIASMGGFPLHISSTALVFIVSVAGLLRINHNNCNN